MKRIGTITVFGSAGARPDGPLYKEAYGLGKGLAERGFAVCNGGYGGTMEASARGALESGGHTIGVVVASWEREPNKWIAETVVASSLFERLRTLVERGDGYVALDGGTGTLLELALVLELMNKQEIPLKPCVIVGDFWRPVVDTVAPDQPSLMDSDAVRLVRHADSAGACLSYLTSVLKPS